jgi:hypothetical protein
MLLATALKIAHLRMKKIATAQWATKVAYASLVGTGFMNCLWL